MVKSKKVTLKEVAAAVNLAVPTVSQILNGRKNFCSEEQCRKVRETAQKMGYITNIGYRIMTGMETRTVGIMVACEEQMQEHHTRELVLLLTGKLSEKGWAAFCHVLPTTPAEAIGKVQEFIGRGVEKFIFIGLPFGHDEIFPILEKNNIPYIGNRETMSCFCRSDSPNARLQLLSHLDRKTGGKFRIAWWKREVSENFFIQRSDIPDVTGKLVELPKSTCGDYYESTFQHGYDTIKKLLENESEISGLMFPNDAYALGAAHYLWEHKIENFTLIGFNGDRELFRFPYPACTGIQPLELIADEMTAFIKDNVLRQKFVPVELILK